MLLRTSWSLRSALGIAALVLVGWLVAPLLDPPPTRPDSAPVPVSSGVQREEPAPSASVVAPSREVASIVPQAEQHGPDDFWGRVLDATTGSPVADAEVVLEHRDTDEMTSLDLAYGERAETIGTVFTDRDGGFAFRVERALHEAAGTRPVASVMNPPTSSSASRSRRRWP